MKKQLNQNSESNSQSGKQKMFYLHNRYKQFLKLLEDCSHQVSQQIIKIDDFRNRNYRISQKKNYYEYQLFYQAEYVKFESQIKMLRDSLYNIKNSFQNDKKIPQTNHQLHQQFSKASQDFQKFTTIYNTKLNASFSYYQQSIVNCSDYLKKIVSSLKGILQKLKSIEVILVQNPLSKAQSVQKSRLIPNNTNTISTKPIFTFETFQPQFNPSQPKQTITIKNTQNLKFQQQIQQIINLLFSNHDLLVKQKPICFTNGKISQYKFSQSDFMYFKQINKKALDVAKNILSKLKHISTNLNNNLEKPTQTNTNKQSKIKKQKNSTENPDKFEVISEQLKEMLAQQYKQQYKDKSIRLNQLDKKLQSANHNFLSLKSNTQSLEKSKIAAQQEYYQLNQKIGQLTKLQQNIAHKDQTIRQLNLQIKRKQASNLQLLQDLKQNKITIDILHNEKQVLKQKLQQTSEQLTKKEKTLEKTKNFSEVDSNSFNNKVVTQGNVAGQSKGLSNQSNSDNKNINNQILRLRGQLAEKQTLIKQISLKNNNQSHKHIVQLMGATAYLQEEKSKYVTETNNLKARVKRTLEALEQDYAAKHSQLQEELKKRVNGLVERFNHINRVVVQQRNQYRQNYEQLSKTVGYLNGVAKAIFKANYQYMAIKNHGEGVNLNLVKQIEASGNKLLSEEQSLQVLGYSLYAINYVQAECQRVINSQRQSNRNYSYIYEYIQQLSKSSDLMRDLELLNLRNRGQKQKSSNYNQRNRQCQQIDKDIKMALGRLAGKVIKQIQKNVGMIISTAEEDTKQRQQQWKTRHKKLSSQIQQLKEEIIQKGSQIKKYECKITQMKEELLNQQQVVTNYRDQINQLQQKLRISTQIQQRLTKQNIKLQSFTQKSLESQKRNLTTSQSQKKKLQQIVDTLKRQLATSRQQIANYQNNLNYYETKIQNLQLSLKQSKSNSRNQDSVQKLLKDYQNQLTDKQNQIKKIYANYNQLQHKYQTVKSQLEKLKVKSSPYQSMIFQTQPPKSNQLILLKQTFSQQKKQLQDRIFYLEKQINRINNQSHAHQANSQNLKQKNTQLQQQNKHLKQDCQNFQYILIQIHDILKNKLNSTQQFQPNCLPDILLKYNPVPVIGCRLITSFILHGYDYQRADIISKIQDQSSKKIKRTDLIGRYPETKALSYYLPKGPFVMIYKTTQGRVFGTFSEGLKLKTFVFAFWVEEQTPRAGSISIGNKVTKANTVQFYMPQNYSENVQSVNLTDRKYLRYGSDELRINLNDMVSISGNSDVTGERYYGDMRWTDVLGDRNQVKVPLSQVQMHKVMFE